jgi:hypothetical protein
MNTPALLAAGAASAAVWAHGVVGQRWFVAQLGALDLQPTKPWGDADVTRRVFEATWHIVTAVFLVTAVTLYLAAFEAFESDAVLRFISIVYGSSLAIGLLYVGTRLETFKRPFAMLVVASQLGVSLLAWLA